MGLPAVILERAAASGLAQDQSRSGYPACSSVLVRDARIRNARIASKLALAQGVLLLDRQDRVIPKKDTRHERTPHVPLRLPTYAPPETLASLRFPERIAMNPDIQLRHDVFAQLNWDPAVNACDVDVRVTNGVVTLVGRVADEAQRAAAERAARRTEGLTTLLNGLTVRPAAVIAR